MAIKQLLHTHTRPFNSLFSRTTRVGRYQKGKINLDFTEARDSEWQWHQLGICKSAPRSRQITMPAPHHSVFYIKQLLVAQKLLQISIVQYDGIMPSVLWHCWLGVRKSIRSVMRCWWGYLPGARYRLSAYGPADATAIPKPHHLLLHSNPDWFYLSSPGLPRQYSHRPLNRCSSSSSHVWKNTCRRLHKTT